MRFALSFFMMSLLLTGCNHHDAELRQKITGTWTVNSNGINGTISVASDGSFISKFSVIGTKITSELIYQGTWRVKDGVLITTITNVDGLEPHEPVGKIRNMKILHMDEHEMAYLVNGETITARRK
ncbi:MAG: hypothetical protein WDM80_00530 [Limisphaerales bacterium]